MAGSLFDRLHRLLDSPAGALLGGTIYGGWAVFSNWFAGLHLAMRSGLTHFALTAGLTLFGAKLMHRLFETVDDPRIGVVVAIFGSLTCTYMLLIGVHLLIGTPHILMTLSLGVIPTLAFCVIFSLGLLRNARQQQQLSFRSVA